MKLCRRALAALLAVATSSAFNSPAVHEEGMFRVYENNRELGKPNYITPDFLLLSYSMILRDCITRHEQNVDYPELREMLKALSQKAQAAPADGAVHANQAFLAVLTALINGAPPTEDLAKEEFELIQSSDSIRKSPLLNETIDYTQFRPRGAYTRRPELSNYFRTVRYAQTAAFYVQESAATGINAKTADLLATQAVLLSQWINSDEYLRRHFSSMQDRQAWLFGPTDDLTVNDVIAATSGKREAKPAECRKDLLMTARKVRHQPTVFSAALDAQKLEPGVTAKDALTAWRLLPGSATPDAAAQQQLVYPTVGKYLGQGNPASLTVVNRRLVKGFPLANEIMALLGSAEAVHTLKDDQNYEHYDRAYIAAHDQIYRPGGLPSEHMQLLSSVILDSQPLDTARGFWTLYRHATVLYTKQSYTAVGKGITPIDQRSSAFLEPATKVYERLRTLSDELHTRLQADSFARLTALLDRCLQISQHEHAGARLQPEEVAFLNDLDKDLLKLTGEADQPIAVDVHTDVNSSQVLTEAIAYPTIVEQDGKRGARFHAVEFKTPMKDRLSDEVWRTKLAGEQK